jgi:benzil reductase ((S)-benzoin forming)
VPHVVVTGVSRGLGEQLALALLRRGFAVTGVGRGNSRRLSGQRYRFVACDLAASDTVEASLAHVFEEIAAARPDSVCVVNNAAVASPIAVTGRLDAQEFTASIAVNLVAPVLVSNVFCRVFKDFDGELRIINVSSGAAETPLPGAGAYCIAKSGVEMLTRVLAAEHKEHGFTAISLRPGIIDTGMQAFMRTHSQNEFPSADLFEGFWKGGQLVGAEIVAEKIARRLIVGDVEHGRTYNYRDL